MAATTADALLIDLPMLSAMLDRSVAAQERDDAAGKLPRPIRLGRLKRWRKAEILDWIECGCPARAEWEATRAAARKRA